MSVSGYISVSVYMCGVCVVCAYRASNRWWEVVRGCLLLITPICWAAEPGGESHTSPPSPGDTPASSDNPTWQGLGHKEHRAQRECWPCLAARKTFLKVKLEWSLETEWRNRSGHVSGSVENLSCAGEQHKRRVVRVEGVCEEGPRPRGVEPSLVRWGERGRQGPCHRSLGVE